MRFFMLDCHGKQETYEKALIEAGHVRVPEIEQADFCMTHYDLEPWRSRLERFRGPIFMYPHAPDCWYHYDIHAEPWNRITCNFVISDLTKNILEKLHYPCPVVVTGFPYCPILPFNYSPIPGNKPRILWAPAHPCGWENTHNNNFNERTDRLLDLVLDQYEVICYHFGTLEDNHIHWNPRILYIPSHSYVPENVWMVLQADIVVARATFLQIASAMGKPAIGMGEHIPFWGIYGGEGTMRHPELMLKWKHPLDLMKESSARGVIGLFERAIANNKDTQAWRERVLGVSFNKQLFLDTIDHYLRIQHD